MTKVQCTAGKSNPRSHFHRFTAVYQLLETELTRLQCWRNRARERRMLLKLDSTALKDIGISRADAVHEADKPFWRP